MKVSFVVLTRNRAVDLVENLRALFSQAYTNKEIVVVDNKSSDDTVVRVRTNFPKARLVTLQTNSGVDAGRNAGIKTATGDVLIFVDDDAVLRDQGATQKIVNEFERNPHLGILGFRERSYIEPHDVIQWHYQGRPVEEWGNKKFEASYYPGAGHAIRATALRQTGSYPGYYFYSTEEKDLSYRMLDHDWEIWYTPDIEVFHKVNLAERNLWRNYFDVRNHMWFAWRNLPWPYSTFHYMAHAANNAARNFPDRLYLVTRGFADGWRRRSIALADRKPISRETQRKIRNLRKSWFWWL